MLGPGEGGCGAAAEGEVDAAVLVFAKSNNHNTHNSWLAGAGCAAGCMLPRGARAALGTACPAAHAAALHPCRIPGALLLAHRRRGGWQPARAGLRGAQGGAAAAGLLRVLRRPLLGPRCGAALAGGGGGAAARRVCGGRRPQPLCALGQAPVVTPTPAPHIDRIAVCLGSSCNQQNMTCGDSAALLYVGQAALPLPPANALLPSCWVAPVCPGAQGAVRLLALHSVFRGWRKELPWR